MHGDNSSVCMLPPKGYVDGLSTKKAGYICVNESHIIQVSTQSNRLKKPVFFAKSGHRNPTPIALNMTLGISRILQWSFQNLKIQGMKVLSLLLPLHQSIGMVILSSL